jgi:hypothetical protein
MLQIIQLIALSGIFFINRYIQYSTVALKNRKGRMVSANKFMVWSHVRKIVIMLYTLFTNYVLIRKLMKQLESLKSKSYPNTIQT